MDRRELSVPWFVAGPVWLYGLRVELALAVPPYSHHEAISPLAKQLHLLLVKDSIHYLVGSC